MRKTKKMLCLVLVLSVLALVLTACSEQATTTSAGSGTTTTKGGETTTKSGETTTETSKGSDIIENINVDSTYPCVNDPIPVEIAFQPQSPNFQIEENWMVRYFDEVTNLDITWTMIDPAGADERITLMLNSDTLPDAVQGHTFSASDIVQYGLDGGMFKPINDLLVYCPELTKLFSEQPEVQAASTATDGMIYGFCDLPNVDSFLLRFFIDSKWLDAVGKENPKTLDELEEMLIAFRDEDANGNGDPNDEIPWAGSWSEGGSERHLIFAAYGYINQHMENIMVDFNKDKPEIAYIAMSDHYKDYLKYMNNLWNENLLDPNLFTQTETQVQATVLEGNIGMTHMSAPYVYDPENELDWIAINAMAKTPSDTPVFPRENPVRSPARFVISADADDETAAALANFADGYYTIETWGFCTYGPEAGTDLDYFGTGHYYDPDQNTILYNLHPNANGAWDHRTTYLTFWNVPGMVSNGYDPYYLGYAEKYPDSAIGQQFKDGLVKREDVWSQIENQMPYAVFGMPDFYMSMDDLETVNSLVTPLDDYLASMEAQFITGDISIDAEFDNFIETLKSYGVEEYTEIYQKYYDMFTANN